MDKIMNEYIKLHEVMIDYILNRLNEAKSKPTENEEKINFLLEQVGEIKNQLTAIKDNNDRNGMPCVMNMTVATNDIVTVLWSIELLMN